MIGQQRQEAIAACNRILTANDRLQAIAADIRRGCDELRALWPQKPQSQPVELEDIEDFRGGGPTVDEPDRPYCKPDQTCCDFTCGN